MTADAGSKIDVNDHPYGPSMNPTVFLELKFWLLVIFSLVLPVAIYWTLLKSRSASRVAVLLLGSALVVIAGIDVYFLQSLSATAKLTPSVTDDAIFASELTLALYALPALFGGIGVNVLSHVLIRHLADAESRFEKERSDA